MTEFLYQGDYSCRLIAENGTVLYIDPDKGKGYDRHADIILQTETAGKSLLKLKIVAKNTKMVNRELLKTNASFSYGGIKIHRPNEDVFVIKIDGLNIFLGEDITYAADTVFDYALVPCCQNTFAPKRIYGSAKRIIPIHTAESALFDYRRAIELRVENKLILEPSMHVVLQQYPLRNLADMEKYLYPLLKDSGEKFRMTMICMNDGYAMAEMPVTLKDMNPLGLVYGGISYNFADIVAGCTFYSAGGYGPTITANYDYIRSTKDTVKLVAIAEDIKRGRNLHFIEVKIFDDAAKLVAKGSFTYFMQK